MDRESGARQLREKVLAASPPADREHAALLEIEEALEAATRDVLEGRGTDPARILDGARGALKA